MSFQIFHSTVHVVLGWKHKRCVNREVIVEVRLAQLFFYLCSVVFHSISLFFVVVFFAKGEYFYFYLVTSLHFFSLFMWKTLCMKYQKLKFNSVQYIFSDFVLVTSWSLIAGVTQNKESQAQDQMLQFLLFVLVCHSEQTSSNSGMLTASMSRLKQLGLSKIGYLSLQEQHQSWIQANPY